MTTEKYTTTQPLEIKQNNLELVSSGNFFIPRTDTTNKKIKAGDTYKAYYQNKFGKTKGRNVAMSMAKKEKRETEGLGKYFSTSQVPKNDNNGKGWYLEIKVKVDMLESKVISKYEKLSKPTAHFDYSKLALSNHTSKPARLPEISTTNTSPTVSAIPVLEPSSEETSVSSSDDTSPLIPQFHHIKSSPTIFEESTASFSQSILTLLESSNNQHNNLSFFSPIPGSKPSAFQNYSNSKKRSIPDSPTTEDSRPTKKFCPDSQSSVESQSSLEELTTNITSAVSSTQRF